MTAGGTAVETGASFEFHVRARALAVCTIVRDGREVRQRVDNPTTGEIVVGAQLLHQVDGRLYRVVTVNPPVYTIARDDGAQYEASLQLVKQHFWLVTTVPV